jgi:hypothetical protein
MIELISIHIAKTGGRSFYEILKNEYGPQLDPRTRRIDYFPGKDYGKPLIDRIPEGISVVHGHLHYAHVAAIHRRHKAKVITWMREPVERVISNYYYMIGMVQAHGDKHPHFRKRKHTLPEYAHDSIPNKMTKCLKGISLDELFFIGFQETFEDDVKKLAELLGWKKPVPDVRLNTGLDFDSYRTAPTPLESITREMKEQIAILNREDIRLFEEARSLKMQS